METVFENVFTGNVEIVSEINRKVWDPKRIPVGWFIIACASVLMAYVVWYRIWGWQIIVAVLLLCFGIYNLNYHHIWAALLMHKTKKENNGQIPSATVTVTDQFNHQYNSITTSFSFSSLEKVFFLKHSIRLISKDGSYMTFQRCGFTKGTAEELEKFIQEHCPQAQMIYKT